MFDIISIMIKDIFTVARAVCQSEKELAKLSLSDMFVFVSYRMDIICVCVYI